MQHVARSKGLINDILFGLVSDRRKRGTPRRRREDDVKELDGMSMALLLRRAQNRNCW